MKKYFSLFAIAAVLFASCAKEQNEQLVTPSSELTFTGITDDGLSKTTLGSDFSIIWSTDDDITVFPGANAAGVKFDVASTAREGKEATFTGSAASSETYYALSPAQDGASMDNGNIKATLPSVQTAVADSFAPEANISVAVASDYVFRFKNIGAIIGVKVGNADVVRIRLEAVGGEPLSGQVTVDPATGEILSRDNCVNYVELSSAGNFSTDKTYYFTVLPCLYQAGFRVKLFKADGSYAAFVKSDNKGIGRNDNHYLGVYTGSKWKTSFTPGDNVKIKGSAEDGQDLAYVASAGYWDSSIQYSNVAAYAYDYEIFTRLTQDQKFYFVAAGGEKFTLNAAGTAVEPLSLSADAAYGAPSDGVYRIRMVLPDGAAEVKRISDVTYDVYGLDSRSMTYQGNGVWNSENFHIRTSSYMNRYRFLVKFDDNTKEYYGRKSTVGGNPVYGAVSADYFYVQPSIDSDADHWSPCFQYPSTFQDIENRYYCTMTLSLNNDAGHYTHSVTNVSDVLNPAGVVFICDSSEAGQQMCFIASDHYNTAMDGYGDNSDLVSSPVSNYFEIFTRLGAGEKFYFYNASTGRYYAPNANGTAVAEISSPAEATYSVSTEGAWRIRADFSAGAANIRRIDQVRTELNYDGGADGAVHMLSYTGKGTWRKDNAVIKGHPGQYGRTLFREYVVKIWFNRDNADNTIDVWQVYGSTSVKTAGPDPSDDGSYWNLQPSTGDNWVHVFYYPSWLIDESNNGRYSATITLYMNKDFSNYTHRFTNVVDSN